MAEDLTFTVNDLEKLRELLPGEFAECQFEGIRFSHLQIKPSSFRNCTFTNCNLTEMEMLSSTMRNIDFAGCNLMGVNWAALNRFEDCRFRECKLDYACFQGLQLKRTPFLDSSLKETDFSECQLSEANFSGSILTGANFNKANLSNANLKRSKEYFIDPAFTKIKGAQFSLPEAIILLTALGAKVEY